MDTLTDRPHITMDVKQKKNKIKKQQPSSLLKNVVSVLLKTMSYQQLLHCNVISAALWPTDDLPRKSEIQCYLRDTLNNAIDTMCRLSL